MDLRLRHCVGGKLLDKHGTVDQPRVTCPRGTASVLEGRERSQPYRLSTRSRADIYNTELTLASERNGLSPSRPTHVCVWRDGIAWVSPMSACTADVLLMLCVARMLLVVVMCVACRQMTLAEERTRPLAVGPPV